MGSKRHNGHAAKTQNINDAVVSISVLVHPKRFQGFFVKFSTRVEGATPSWCGGDICECVLAVECRNVGVI